MKAGPRSRPAVDGSFITERNSCALPVCHFVPSSIYYTSPMPQFLCSQHSAPLKCIDHYLYQWLVCVQRRFRAGSYQKSYIFVTSAYQRVCHVISARWWGFENVCRALPQPSQRGLLPTRPSPPLYYLWKLLCDCVRVWACVCVRGPSQTAGGIDFFLLKYGIKHPPFSAMYLCVCVLEIST